MAVKTYSIDNEIAQKFKEKTPEQETSKVLEQLMEDYLNESVNKEIQLDLKNMKLSDSQQQLLDLLVEKNVNSKSTNALFSLCKKESIYGRSHHFGEGLKSVVQNEEIPYTREGDKIKSKEFNCECGCSMDFSVLVKNKGVCLNCERKIVRY